jgi:hypothetical protein
MRSGIRKAQRAAAGALAGVNSLRSRMLTYAHVCVVASAKRNALPREPSQVSQRSRMLAYAHVCSRMRGIRKAQRAAAGASFR